MRYENLVANDTDCPSVYNNLGYLFYREAKMDKAIPYFQKALSLRPFYAEAHKNIGLTLAARAKWSWEKK